jgi:hypothetical protein
MPERVEFTPPKGVVPEDIKKGDTFDLVSTYRLKDDGEICLIQIGDTKMPGYEEGEYESKTKADRQSYGDVVDSMHASMAAGGEGGNPGGGY